MPVHSVTVAGKIASISLSDDELVLYVACSSGSTLNAYDVSDISAMTLISAYSVGVGNFPDAIEYL